MAYVQSEIAAVLERVADWLSKRGRREEGGDELGRSGMGGAAMSIKAALVARSSSALGDVVETEGAGPVGDEPRVGADAVEPMSAWQDSQLLYSMA